MFKSIVAIDGPSGGGKSTVSRALASLLHFTYLDTGAMYRAVAYTCREKGVDVTSNAQLESLLAALRIELQPPAEGEDDVRVFVDGQDVSRFLRTPEMGMLASQVSALPTVRRNLTTLQQQIGSKGRIVAEGRDTGTVVFPEAPWKFFLDASPEIRAHRRAKQLRGKGKVVDEQQLLAQIIQRDKDDRERTLAPLKAAPDALFIDSSRVPVEDVVRLMYEKIKASSRCLGE